MPSVVRLIRAADLDAWQRALVSLCQAGAPETHLTRVVLVPSRQAGEQLRRTIEHRVLHEGWTTPAALAVPLGLPLTPAVRPATVVMAPRSVTRDGWYELVHALSGDSRPRVTPIAQEVLMAAAAREAAAAGTPAPFLIRPGLVAEMVRLREAIGRLGHGLDSAAATLLPDLEAEAASDRGAARLLQQTHFLLAAFGAYDASLARAGLLDEATLRRAVVPATARLPVRHVVVTVGDHRSDPDGLWPADFEHFDSLDLDRLDVLYTGREGQVGFERRCRERWPDALAVRVDSQRPARGRLETPSSDATWFTFRDREEEVIGFARRLKATSDEDVSHTALVYRRPLPYLYLAQQVLTTAGVPYEAAETLPLAAEPWAAALDVLVDSVLADHTRSTLVAWLRHPLFLFVDAAGVELPPRAVEAFDRLLARDRYLGSPARLIELVEAWRDGHTVGSGRDLPGALQVASTLLPLLASLEPLRHEAPAALHLDRLADVLERLARPIEGDASAVSRSRRVRAAVRDVIDTLRAALREFDSRPVRAREACAVLRRWIEGHTFAARRGGHGVQVLDAASARFAVVRHMRLVGLVDGEWPEATARNVFYPSFLLARLGWPDERERTAATRAAFADLLDLPSEAVGVSVPELEQDAVVRPSALLDELAVFPPSRRLPVPADQATRIVTSEGALLAPEIPVPAWEAHPEAREWLQWRITRGQHATPSGQTEPTRTARYSVTAVERYLQCPFQYFAASILRLGEEPDDEDGLPSRDAGVFVHDVLRACFAAWERAGHLRITPDDLPAARALFHEVAEHALLRLPPADRPLERLRLFGSSVASGLLEKVLRVEVESFGDVASRELELEFDGHVTVPVGDGERRVPIRGRIDRVDRTDEGGVRVIDYKSGRRPQQDGLQPAVYALAMVERDRDLGRPSTVAQSGYVALREVSPWAATVKRADDAAADARTFGEAVASIEAGEFPVRPASIFRCRFCAYPNVCRKDYVGDD